MKLPETIGNRYLLRFIRYGTKFEKCTVNAMDRRQRKTRAAIFDAFISLLAEQDFAHITVEQILRRADIGRATFYAHFETKDFLLKAFCEELFCHILDAAGPEKKEHKHIFDCDAPDGAFLHLFRHLQKNDNHILQLLSRQNNGLFMEYFRSELKKLVISQLSVFEAKKAPRLPEDFWVDHITATFVQTLRWWLETGVKASPETITEYFFLAV